MTPPDHEFWKHNRVRSKKGGAFEQLSLPRRVCLLLLAVFSLVWTFTMGVAIAGADNKSYDGPLVNAETLNQSYLVSDDGMRVILAVGCDRRDGDLGRTDTIMVAFIDEENKEVNVISIPRDTYVTIPSSGGKTKINHAYAYGGIALTEATIEKAFGIAVDNYVEIDFEGFTRAVDAIGGVEIEVPFDMDNEWENIHLKEGLQVLDGENALGFVRFRESIHADIGRIERQQMFLDALADEALSPAKILRLPSAINAVWDNLQTDLSLKEMLALASYMRDFDRADLHFWTLPGDGQYINGVSYWVYNDLDVVALMDEIFNPQPEEQATPQTEEDTENI